MNSPRIIYEDDWLVVVDKPAGCSSESEMPAALRAAWGSRDAYIGVVHRLDTVVSGLMVYAKTPKMAGQLSRLISESAAIYAARDGAAGPSGWPEEAPRFVKQYRAVIAGAPDEKLAPQGLLRDYLYKDARKGKVFPVDRPRRGVKEAMLEYRVLSTVPHGEGSLSLAEITLHTGRTHQIRAQFAARRHPLWGDGKYGSRYKGEVALQSANLRFWHPAMGKEMRFALDAPQGEPWSFFR